MVAILEAIAGRSCRPSAPPGEQPAEFLLDEAWQAVTVVSTGSLLQDRFEMQRDDLVKAAGAGLARLVGETSWRSQGRSRVFPE